MKRLKEEKEVEKVKVPGVTYYNYLKGKEEFDNSKKNLEKQQEEASKNADKNETSFVALLNKAIKDSGLGLEVQLKESLGLYEFNIKDRKELSKVLENLNKVNIKASIKRGVAEGYRYLLQVKPITEAKEFDKESNKKGLRSTKIKAKEPVKESKLKEGLAEYLEMERQGEKDNEYLVINARRVGYGIDQVEDDGTMTVGELINLLSDYQDNVKVIVGNDFKRGDWYTYGPLTEGDVYDVKIVEGESDENDEYDESKKSCRKGKSLKEDIDIEALEAYANMKEGDNITVTADLLNVLEKALEMAKQYGVKESCKGKKCKKQLKETWAGEDVIDDITERAQMMYDDGNYGDIEDCVTQAIDEGLIYTKDIYSLLEHYGSISDSEIIESFFDDLWSDVYNGIEEHEEEDEDDEDEDIDESKKQECKKKVLEALKKRAFKKGLKESKKLREGKEHTFRFSLGLDVWALVDVEAENYDEAVEKVKALSEEELVQGNDTMIKSASIVGDFDLDWEEPVDDDDFDESLKEDKDVEVVKKEETVVEEQQLNEIYPDRLVELADKVKKEHEDFVKEAEEKLEASTSKEEDFAILSVFWNKVLDKIFEEWDEADVDALVDDAEATFMPMPESVHKQFVSYIFEDKINNLNVLSDLEVYDDFLTTFDLGLNDGDYEALYNDLLENTRFEDEEEKYTDEDDISWDEKANKPDDAELPWDYGKHFDDDDEVEKETTEIKIDDEGVEEIEKVLEKSNTFEFESGDYCYVGYKDGKLFAGSATNSGIMHDVEIDYDKDLSVDENLERLYNAVIEKHPEYLDF